jgi:DeoR family transcriptional regulator, fructose operon transcriptional repressor
MPAAWRKLGKSRQNIVPVEKLYPEERLIKIMDILKHESKVEVDRLARDFQVTGATIRADLRELENRNLILRTHGGAMLKEALDEGLKTDRDPVYEQRVLQNLAAKEAIGRAAVQLIRPGESIMLDDGSTTLQVAKHLPADQPINVVTNGLNICLELASHPNAHVIATGGALKKEDLSYHGRVAEDVVTRFNTDKSILGASGVSLREGVTTPSEHKAELKKTMIRHSREVIIVADHTKLMRVSFVPVCPLEAIRSLVTDAHAPAEVVKQFEKQGVHVILSKYQ